MKKVITSFAFVLILTSMAFGMGWFGGGHQNDGGTIIKSSSPNEKNNTGDNQVGGTVNTTTPSEADKSKTTVTASLPEPRTLILLAFALGLLIIWYLTRKRRKLSF